MAYARHRSDPIKVEEWTAIRATLPRLMAELKFGTDEYRQAALQRYEVCFDAFWELGCHPICLARPDRAEFSIRHETGGWVAQWKRPKTGNWCLMPVDEELAGRLQAYIAGSGWPSRKRLWEVMRECARMAEVPGVTPLTLRHTVAMRLFKLLGPSGAKESLQVGDRALQHYTALSAETRLNAIRAAMTKTDPAETSTVSKVEGG